MILVVAVVVIATTYCSEMSDEWGSTSYLDGSESAAPAVVRSKGYQATSHTAVAAE